MKRVFWVVFFTLAIIGNAVAEIPRITNSNHITGDVLSSDTCNQPNPIFEQLPTDCAAPMTLIPSDVGSGDIVYDDYEVIEDIYKVHFWGAVIYHPYGHYCDEDPMNFNIFICPDNGNGIPDTNNPVNSYVVTLNYDPQPVCTSPETIWEWESDLEPHCSLREGWIAIQGFGGLDSCIFIWVNSDQAYGYYSWKNDHYTDLHQAFCLNGNPEIKCLACSTICWTPSVPNDNGTIIWDLSVVNCGSISLNPIIGEIIPTDIDCNGTMFDFDLTKQLTSSLTPGSSFERTYYYRPGTVNDVFADVALNIYVGESVNDYLGNCCFEFTFAAEWGRKNNSNYWGIGNEWGEYNGGAIPTKNILTPNYPNPFNSTTTIPFKIANGSDVNLCIYNIAGQLVETLYDSHMESGNHKITWDASKYASGVYYCKLTVDNYITTKKIELIK